MYYIIIRAFELKYFWMPSCRRFFFFKQKTAYEMRISDWSSDVCSSDLPKPLRVASIVPALHYLASPSPAGSSMPHHTSLIAILCVGFVLAFVLGMVAQRLRLSPLVGYLVAGIIAGPFTPGFVGAQSLAPQLAEIGVILLMVGVGLHFSLKDLMAVKAIAIPGAIVQITVATVLAWGLSPLPAWPPLQCVNFGFSPAH